MASFDPARHRPHAWRDVLERQGLPRRKVSNLSAEERYVFCEILRLAFPGDDRQNRPVEAPRDPRRDDCTEWNRHDVSSRDLRDEVGAEAVEGGGEGRSHDPASYRWDCTIRSAFEQPLFSVPLDRASHRRDHRRVGEPELANGTLPIEPVAVRQGSHHLGAQRPTIRTGAGE